MSKIFSVFFLLSIGFSNPTNFIVFTQDTLDETPTEQADRYLKELQEKYAEGQYELHKAYSDSLLDIARTHNLIKMQVLAYTNQAVFYNNRSERLKAIALYHLALDKCKDIPEDFRTKIIVLVNMGNIYNNIGSYDKSIKYMKNVLELLDANENNDKIRAAALLGLGNNYIEFDNYEKILFYSEKAKHLGEKIGNEMITVSAINNLNNAYILLKNYDKVLELNKAVANTEFINKPTKKRALFLLNNGIANYYLNNFDVALLDLKASQELSEAKKILETQMYAHEYLAKVYEQKKDFKTSILEQKKYASIRELFLKDKKDASIADLNQEINFKTEIIAENNAELEGFSKNKKTLLIASITLLVILGGLLFYNITRKKTLKVSQVNLQNQYQDLQNDFTSYKDDKLSTQNSEKHPVKPYKNSSLTPEIRETYKAKILAFMTTEKPFLDPEMTQAKLAEKLGVSSHHFSEVLNYNMDQNFYNFINSYRILEAQELMKNPKHKEDKIIAIAFDSGFKSKSTFNRIFKNYTGITPSEYRQEIS